MTAAVLGDTIKWPDCVSHFEKGGGGKEPGISQRTVATFVSKNGESYNCGQDSCYFGPDLNQVAPECESAD